MNFWYQTRNVVLIAVAAGGLVGCSTDSMSPTGGASLDPTGDAYFVENVGLSAQSLPNAVFRTVPPADGDDAIRGNNPLTVQFNNCQSRPTDEADDLKFTYDFDNDGNVDEHGHCRWEHTYTRAATARICVLDRRNSEVCRNWEIRPSVIGVPAPPVPGPTPHLGNPPSATWTTITVVCTPRTTTINMRVTDPDNDTVHWSASLTGGTLTTATSGGPVTSGSIVAVSFTGISGLSTVTMNLVDSKGVPSMPITRFGPAATCGGQILHILG